MASPRRASPSSGLAMLIAAALALATMLPILLARPAQVTAQGPATPARPTQQFHLSRCTGVVTSSVTADTVRVCDTVTTTVKLEPACPYCLGGISLVFVMPEVAMENSWMAWNIEMMLIEVDRYQKEYERDFDHELLVQAGVVIYDAEVARTRLAMTSELRLVNAEARAVRQDVQDGGPYPEAARTAVQLLRSASRTSEARDLGGHKACLEIVVFFGSREGSTLDRISYRNLVGQARSIIVARTPHLYAGCTASLTVDYCGFFVYLQLDSRLFATRWEGHLKFRNAVVVDLRNSRDDRPEELVRDVVLTQRLPAGLSYVPGSAIPPPAAVITGGGETVLRWDWIPFRKMEPKTVTYAVRPVQEGIAPIEGGFDLEDVNGMKRTVPMASRPITVTGLCVTLTPTPTDTPTSTPTPTPTDTPTPTPTATPTSTPTPTPTLKPGYMPIVLNERPPAPLYLPLLLIERCEPKQQRVDVVLVIDASTSMAEATRSGRTKLSAAQEAARIYLDELGLAAGDQAAVVSFNEQARLAQGLISDRAALESALAGISLAPLTCLVCGIEAASAELHGPRRLADHTPVLILLTDGRSNPRPVAEAEASAANAKAGGVVLFTIGIGEDLDADALARIASRPDFFYRAPDAEELGQIYREIAVAIPCPADAYWGGR